MVIFEALYEEYPKTAVFMFMLMGAVFGGLIGFLFGSLTI